MRRILITIKMIDFSFPKSRNDWNLDVVSILAFLGEHNILATSQQMCMSRICLLPRLMPAPQGLLAQRQKDPASEDNITIQDIYTGSTSNVLPYYARVVLGTHISHLPMYTTQVLQIEPIGHEWPFQLRLLSPLNMISMFSCAISLGLLIWALVLGDAVALTGILLMSFSTPLLCYGLRWNPRRAFRFRPSILQQKPTVVVIKNPHGTLTIVRCTLVTAHILYFDPIPIRYSLSSAALRTLTGVVPGLTLVCSIVLFGNATWPMKAALIVVYAVLNLLYWVATIFPPSYSWHVNYSIETESKHDNATFSKMVWTAVWATKSSSWAKEHVPASKAWLEWLEEAERAAQTCREHTDWDPESALSRLLGIHHPLHDAPIGAKQV